MLSAYIRGSPRRIRRRRGAHKRFLPAKGSLFFDFCLRGGEAHFLKKEYIFEVNGLRISAEFHSVDVERVFLPLLRKLTQLRHEKGRRVVAFLAGPPAAGKSTLCRLLETLSEQDAALAPVQCVGIDGFHYPQAYLDSHALERDGRSIPLSRIKGAPETYDVRRLRALLESADGEGQRWPLYDRRIHDPVEDAIEIRREILIVEGNWLLLDEAPWNALNCDFSVFMKMGSRDQLERIVRRKMMGGYDEKTARDFVENNDWPNIRRCMAHSRRGDWTIQYDNEGLMEVIL